MTLPSTNNIILCGFMASGKTSIGRLLSKKLSYNYIDTDELIEKNTGMSVSDIFKQYGETYFRELEFKTASEMKNYKNTVISTGGGMLTFERNSLVLKEAGSIVYIKREFDSIYQTLIKEDKRPLAKQKNKEELRQLYDERMKKYTACADYIVNNNRHIMHCVDEIAKICKPKP